MTFFTRVVESTLCAENSYKSSLTKSATLFHLMSKAAYNRNCPLFIPTITFYLTYISNLANEGAFDINSIAILSSRSLYAKYNYSSNLWCKLSPFHFLPSTILSVGALYVTRKPLLLEYHLLESKQKTNSQYFCGFA